LEEENYVEYDLDSEDEAWLADLNKDQQRLTATQLERFLDTLEHANVGANMRADGAGPDPLVPCQACCLLMSANPRICFAQHQENDR
jgi:hypothetical protein